MTTRMVRMTGLDLHFLPGGAENKGSPRSSPRRRRSSAPHGMGSSPALSYRNTTEEAQGFLFLCLVRMTGLD